MARLGGSAEKESIVNEVYLPSAIQKLARPAKAKTEMNFMLISWRKQEVIEESGNEALGDVDFEIVPQQGGAMS
jgi:hypothetical protein